MPFHILLFIFLLIQTTEAAEKDCEDIVPKSAEDCVLSKDDKDNYDYCCYVEFYGDKSCSGETKESYGKSMELFKAMATKQDKFDCQNETGFIFPRLIYFLLILLNL